jgi:O-antigen/teichoic acid export membrane protein
LQENKDPFSLSISKLNINIGANLLGTLWSIFSIYFFLPFYLKFLGEEAYGLVMFAVTIQAVIMLLDAGFSSALRRELAWSNTESTNNKSSLFLTIEAFYAVIFIVLGLCTILFSDWLATNWFVNTTLPKTIVKTSIILMTINAVLQIQSSLYNGSLLALDHQIKANFLQFVFTLFRNGFVIFIIFLTSSPVYFLIWQMIITIVYLFIQRIILTKTFTKHKFKEGFVDFNLLKNIWTVSSLFLLISILSTINLQIDKIIISRIMDFKNLGYYNTVYSLGQITVSLCGPIATALTPLVIKAYSSNKIADISTLFHKYSKISTVLCFSLGTTLLLDSQNIIRIWTNNESFVHETNNSAGFIIFAGMMLACQVVPYTLGIASASMKPIIFTCIVNIILTVPAYIYLGEKMGLQGFAIVWCVSNILMMLVNVYFFINNTIPRQYLNWLFFDFFLPALALGITFMLSVIRPHFSQKLLELMSIGGVFAISCLSLFSIFFFKELKGFINNLLYNNEFSN